MTFLGFIILLASNGCSYIVGRDGLAKVRWERGNVMGLAPNHSHPGSLLTRMSQWVA